MTREMMSRNLTAPGKGSQHLPDMSIVEVACNFVNLVLRLPNEFVSAVQGLGSGHGSGKRLARFTGMIVMPKALGASVHPLLRRRGNGGIAIAEVVVFGGPTLQ